MLRELEELVGCYGRLLASQAEAGVEFGDYASHVVQVGVGVLHVAEAVDRGVLEFFESFASGSRALDYDGGRFVELRRHVDRSLADLRYGGGDARVRERVGHGLDRAGRVGASSIYRLVELVGGRPRVRELLLVRLQLARKRLDLAREPLRLLGVLAVRERGVDVLLLERLQLLLLSVDRRGELSRGAVVRLDLRGGRRELCFKLLLLHHRVVELLL